MKKQNTTYSQFKQNSDLQAFLQRLGTLNAESLKTMINQLAADFLEVQTQIEYEKQMVQSKVKEIEDQSQRIEKLKEENKKLLLQQQQLISQQQQKSEQKFEQNSTVTSCGDSKFQTQQNMIADLKKQNENLRQVNIQLEEGKLKQQSTITYLTNLNKNLNKKYQEESTQQQDLIVFLQTSNKQLEEKLYLTEKVIKEHEEKILRLENLIFSASTEAKTLFEEKAVIEKGAQLFKTQNDELLKQLNSFQVQCQELSIWKEKIGIEQQSQKTNQDKLQEEIIRGQNYLKMQQEENMNLKSQFFQMKNYSEILLTEKIQLKESNDKLEGENKLLHDQNQGLLINLEKLHKSFGLLEESQKSLLNYKEDKIQNYELQIQNFQKTIQQQQKNHREQLQQYITIQSLSQNPFINNIKLKETTQKLQESWNEIYKSSSKARDDILKLLNNLRVNSQDQQKQFLDAQTKMQILYLKDRQKDIIQQINNLIEKMAKKKASQLDIKDKSDLQQIIDFLSYSKVILERNCYYLDQCINSDQEFQKRQEKEENTNQSILSEIESKMQEQNAFSVNQSNQVNQIMQDIQNISQQPNIHESNFKLWFQQTFEKIEQSHFIEVTEALKEMIINFIEASQKNSIFTCYQARFTVNQIQNIDISKRETQNTLTILRGMIIKTAEQFLEMLRISIQKLAEIIDLIESEGQGKQEIQFIQHQKRSSAPTQYVLHYLRNFLESIYNQFHDDKKLNNQTNFQL